MLRWLPKDISLKKSEIEILDEIKKKKKQCHKVLNIMKKSGGRINTKEIMKSTGCKDSARIMSDIKDYGVEIQKDDKKTYILPNNEIRYIKKLGPKKRIPRYLKKQLYELYDGKCSLCAAPISLSESEPDHRIPRAINGDPDFTPENYVLICINGSF